MSEIRAAARHFVFAAAAMPAIRVVTYNIHGCVGLDRRYDPARIAAVLREIDADIVCLQEVDARGGRVARRPGGLSWRSDRSPGHPRRRPPASARGRFANAILTRFPSLAARAIDLAVPGYEPRGAIDVDLMIGHRVLRVMATHFGLHAGERRLQANRLIAALGEPAEPNRPPAARGAAGRRFERMARAQWRRHSRARPLSRAECDTAHLSLLDAGAAARPDLCAGAGGAARCPRLPLAAGARRLRSFAADRKFVVERRTGAPPAARMGFARMRRDAYSGAGWAPACRGREPSPPALGGDG